MQELTDATWQVEALESAYAQRRDVQAAQAE